MAKAKNIRQWLNKNSALATVAMIAVLALAIGAIAWQMKGPSYAPVSVDTWFYDLKSGEVFVAKSDRTPPIKTDNGPLANGMPAGVRALVFACGSCETGEQFIGWLQMELTDEQAQRLLAKNDDGSGPEGTESSNVDLTPEDRVFIRSGEVPVRPELVGKWVQKTSVLGTEIMETVLGHCGGASSPQPCKPAEGTPPEADLRNPS
ncbi:MAG: hypothetical protein R3336_00775 [Phycisphaeraceae bacterium]|nr:hypothetical protein [Phycisphaeraceae bacterium]